MGVTMGAILILVVSCGTGKSIGGGPISHASLKDGTYDGSARNGPVKVKAKITISEQKITDIDLIEHRTWKGGAAEGIIPNRIIETQSTKVDAVSGATMSSVAIMNAVEDAVQKAK
jgi:uncharacterized protein with FMN-binding domain